MFKLLEMSRISSWHTGIYGSEPELKLKKDVVIEVDDPSKKKKKKKLEPDDSESWLDFDDKVSKATLYTREMTWASKKKEYGTVWINQVLAPIWDSCDGIDFQTDDFAGQFEEEDKQGGGSYNNLYHTTPVIYVENVKRVHFNQKNVPDDRVELISIDDALEINARICKKCGKQWQYQTGINLPVVKNQIVQKNTKKGRNNDRQHTMFVPKEVGIYTLKMVYGHGTFEEMVDAGQ